MEKNHLKWHFNEFSNRNETNNLNIMHFLLILTQFDADFSYEISSVLFFKCVGHVCFTFIRVRMNINTSKEIRLRHFSILNAFIA